MREDECAGAVARDIERALHPPFLDERLALPRDCLEHPSNVWVLPTGGGPLRQITDFGTRAALIVRSIAWSPDSRAVYAAVADTDADIVLLNGLLR